MCLLCACLDINIIIAYTNSRRIAEEKRGSSTQFNIIETYQNPLIADLTYPPHGKELPVIHYHEIMVIYPYPFCGNYPIIVLDNIYELLCMYINGFTWIVFFDNCIWYTKKLGATRILQLSQHNGKLPLPWLEHVNYPVMTIYAPNL